MMSIQKYLEEMKKIQVELLDFLDSEENTEEKFQNLLQIFKDIKILENRYEMKSFLHLIHKISSNHYRGPNFYSKIIRLLQLFKESIKKEFSNSEIFIIFKFNYGILLFFLEEQIFKIDESIIKLIKYELKKQNTKIKHFFQFFLPEIKPYIEEKYFPEYLTKDLPKEIPENFYEKRKISENDNLICELIREDSIKDFIVFIKKNSYELNSIIQESFYETNYLLIKRKTITLIQYAVFFGSIQIFNYLINNGVKLTSSLWLFAIHGQNAEIFHILEDNNVSFQYNELLEESIKCHHSDVVNYIEYNLINGIKNPMGIFFNQYCVKYYNFVFMQLEFINESMFQMICKYDYYLILYDFVKRKNFDINKPLVLKEYFNIIPNHLL